MVKAKLIRRLTMSASKTLPPQPQKNKIHKSTRVKKVKSQIVFLHCMYKTNLKYTREKIKNKQTVNTTAL